MKMKFRRVLPIKDIYIAIFPALTYVQVNNLRSNHAIFTDTIVKDEYVIKKK